MRNAGAGRGIEKNEKNSLCKDLIGFVNPCEVAETITEEMKESYTSEFENRGQKKKHFDKRICSIWQN